MSSKYTMSAWAPFGLDEDGLPVNVTFTYTRGRPASLYGAAPHPAEPAEVEFDSVSCADLSLPPHYQDKLDDWAREYLASDHGRGRAIDKADDER